MSDDTPTAGLKARLRADLTAAMKARDTTVTGTLRMALAAITNAEVAGKEAVELTDDEVVAVLTKEVKKRHESAEVYAAAGRDELAGKENAEAEILGRYLPAQLTDRELDAVVGEVVAGMTEPGGRAPTMRQMGVVIKTVKDRVGPQAEGSRIASAVKAALSQ